MSKDYYLESKVGDVVKFPNGDLGIVVSCKIVPVDCDIVCTDNVKEIKIYPFVGFWKRLIGNVKYNCWRFTEDDINKLENIGSITFN